MKKVIQLRNGLKSDDPILGATANPEGWAVQVARDERMTPAMTVVCCSQYDNKQSQKHLATYSGLVDTGRALCGKSIKNTWADEFPFDRNPQFRPQVDCTTCTHQQEQLS
jgi:hypothetical protein